MNELKTYYSAQELVDFQLRGLPTTKKAVITKAKREHWQSRKRTGRGGGLEYELTSLPQSIQQEIYRKFALAVVQKPRTDLVQQRESLDVYELSDKQRAIADARMALVAYVTEIEQVKTRRDAVAQVVAMAKYGTLPSHLMETIALANAKQRQSSPLSERSLMGWVVDYHKCSNPIERLKRLAPIGLGRKKNDIFSLPWLHDLLAVWGDPNRPTLKDCIRSCRNWSAHQLPSDSAIFRTWQKLPVIIRERGRVTGAAYKQFLPYVERDWSVLPVNGAWVGDGHGFKAKVKHPLSGRPFKPEITAIIDGRTRYIVGWSVHMSESCLAVADALRHGIERCGLPHIYYSDNGGGEKNKRLDADLTGILPRLGITHTTGIPGNAQGRGLIERFWRTKLIPLARSYDSFDGANMDNDTKRQRYKALVSAENALNNGKVLTSVQKKALNGLPAFTDFLADLAQAVEEYNHSPHSSLPKVNNEHLSPAVYRETLLTEQSAVAFLDEFELSLLFRPEEIRQVGRGVVELFTHRYFSTALAMYQGEKVRVCYDLHNPETVIVKTMAGSWICVAELDGNKRDAFPRSVREMAQEKALQAAIKRKEAQIANKKALFNPVVTIEHNEGAALLKGLRMHAIKPKERMEEIAVFPSELRRKQG